MNNFFDIHTHILYGVDDGAVDIEQAERMLDIAYAGGTRSVIFTPHYRSGFDAKKVNANIKSLESVLAKYSGLEAYSGAEVMYNSQTVRMLEEGKIPTLAQTRYVLVEFTPDITLNGIIVAVQDIFMCGYTPILAHIERYSNLYKSDLFEITRTGALIQINAKSVMGGHGYKTKRFCDKLLKKRRVHFIASDSHDDTRRTPDLDECARYVEKKYSKEYAEDIFCNNAKKIVADKKI